MLNALLGWKGYAAVAVLCFLAGSASVWRVMSWKEGAAETTGLKAEIRHVQVASAITVNVGDIVVRGIEIAHAETDRRYSEIPKHVTPEIDAAFPVPLGFVRVWNDAAHGPIPPGSLGADAAPSGVPLSDVAYAHTADQGTLDICRVRLAGWQEWYTKQLAAWPK